MALIQASEAGNGAFPQYLSQTVGISARAMRDRLARLAKAGYIVAVAKSPYDPGKRYLPAKKENL